MSKSTKIRKSDRDKLHESHLESKLSIIELAVRTNNIKEAERLIADTNVSEEKGAWLMFTIVGRSNYELAELFASHMENGYENILQCGIQFDDNPIKYFTKYLLESKIDPSFNDNEFIKRAVRYGLDEILLLLLEDPRTKISAIDKPTLVEVMELECNNQCGDDADFDDEPCKHADIRKILDSHIKLNA